MVCYYLNVHFQGQTVNNRDSGLVPFVVCSFSVMTSISLEGLETNLRENKGEREWFEVVI
jgi:hypothetical protein